ncbi:MAG: sugar transferase [Pseudomonadota bacterium]|nr:sugar transferase [Pseudomonadota bacterium]
MRIFGIPYTPRQLHSALGDMLVALVVVYLTHAAVSALGADPPGFGVWNALSPCLLVGSTLIALYVMDAYNSSLDFRRMRQLLRLWTAVVLAMLFQCAIYAVVPAGSWGRDLSGLTALGLVVLLPAWRAALGQLSPRPPFRVKTLVIGTGRAAHQFVAAVRAHPDHDRVYDVAGFVDHPRGEGLQVAPSAPLLGTAAELEAVVSAHGIELIVVALPGDASSEIARQLLACKARGVRIEDMPTIYTRLMGKVPILHLPERWLIFGPEFVGTRRLAAAAFRLADIVIGLVGVVLSAPVVAIAAAAVRLESKGPAFYLQERLGQGERPFAIIKLRTMRQDAEASSGAVWSQGSGDPRVTRVGRFLRRSRIDELPQFYNVLRGDMSIVGPRPEREHFVRQLKERIPFYALRFSVKPGVTGWAQVEYRYGATDEDAAEKLCYELYAIQEMSPALYGLILLKTVQTVLLRPGS